jgi:prepilin-type processing-associated H-X9-DG protein
MIVPMNLGYGYMPDNWAVFGAESASDGLSNTGLFSEKLHGLANNINVFPGTFDGLRGMFKNNAYTGSGGPSQNYSGGTYTDALNFVQACRAIPSNQPGEGGLPGMWWIVGSPWNLAASSYTHFNTPGGLSCYSPKAAIDVSNGPNVWGNPDGAVTPTSAHPGGVNLGMADGSVKFVKNSVSLQTWWALGTRNQGEVITSDSY